MKARFLISICLVLCLSVAAEDVRLLEPGHPAIRPVGRFTEDHRSAWTGSCLELTFTGTTLRARLSTQKPVGYEVVINGSTRFLKVTADTRVYTLAEGLDADRTHTATLFRRSEASFGPVRFEGFEVDADARVAAPEAPDRRMLVIGDSITCGYGNEAVSIDEGNTVDNENGWLAYAPIVARRLDADLHMICWSGRGLFRNRMLKYDQHETMPKLFNRTLPSTAKEDWDPGQYVPDMVVINLGTNDATDRNGQKSSLEKKDYVLAYQNFIRTIRKDAPNCTIFLTLGPMGHKPITQEWLQNAAEPFKNVHVFLYTPFAGKPDIGGHWHPSVAKHRKMADQLISEVEAHTDWRAEPDR